MIVQASRIIVRYKTDYHASISSTMTLITGFSFLQHLKDLSVIYDKYKGRRNVLLGHCYGGVHALRLVKQLNDQGRVNELVGVVILCLGDKCLPGTMLGYLPAPVLGEWAYLKGLDLQKKAH